MTIELLPLSTAEILKKPRPSFMDNAFKAQFSLAMELTKYESTLSFVLRGGFPEVQTKSELTRYHWLKSYVERLAQKDIPDLFSTRKTKTLLNFIEYLALMSSNVLKLQSCSQHIAVSSKTLDQWLRHLCDMWIVGILPGWNHKQHLRLSKAPKIHFLDTGLLSALKGLSLEELQNFSLSTTKALGGLFETFVYTELTKLTQLEDRTPKLYHFRDRSQNEVDFVLERGQEIVGIEVKASMSVHRDDFKGLKKLKTIINTPSFPSYRFCCGIVLYRGDRVSRCDKDLYALPISMLWH